MYRIESMKTPDEGRAAALAALVAACPAEDGEAALETESGLNLHRDMKSLYCAYREDELAGALSVFAPRAEEAEIGAFVRPDARRRGVFRALLAAAEGELESYGYAEELFVVDARSASGRAVVGRLGARYDFTEYSMRFAGPRPWPPDGGPEVVRAGPEHIPALVDLRAGEFGDSREEAEAFERATFAAPGRRQYAGFLAGALVCACSLGIQGGEASLNGFVLDKALRGRGYGQAFLARILALPELRDLEIVLDVDSENANAYHIYKKLGFSETKAVEYHRRASPWA